MADICFQGKLAEAVENHPCLYDFHLKEYSNRDKVQRAWEKVAQELNSSVKECKDSWRNMRIVFTRNLKLPPSGAKAKKKPWPLLQAMMFLKPYVTAKGIDQPSNLPSLPPTAADSSAAEEERVDDVLPLLEEPAEEGIEETNKGIEAGSSCTIGKKKTTPHHPPKKTVKPVNADEVVLDYINSKKKVVSENPRKQFLLSILPDVEDMTVPQFKKFRRDVLNLIDQIDEPAWTYQPPSVSPQSWSVESGQSLSNPLPVLPRQNYIDEGNDRLYTELAPFLNKPLE
ncbi:uncharacterized protein LOC129002362 [Macrosteles quadrilineatus]|uniref:uncharacterized protein LOC129002362 n=1 Tax=Macrosteles quadrilineatus TaxID=74068 RepID=UPI0023E2C4EA|nr:uncharacterized protein LOC129002362 [Macrosteles quadrilineatus]